MINIAQSFYLSLIHIYRVHLLNGDWLHWVDGYDINDSNKGYAGIKGKVIDAIQVEFSGVGDYKATYRVRKQRAGCLLYTSSF